MKNLTYKLLLDINQDKHVIGPVLQEVNLNPYPIIFYKNPIDEKITKDSYDFFFIRFVPDYFNIYFQNLDTYSLKKINYLKGCAISLTGFQDENLYVKYQFKKKSDNIRRYVNRLEACFDIEYKMFYGTIDFENYQMLLDQMSEMILKRFDTLTETNHSLNDLEWIREKAYALILQKKASLFVIYNNERPISITFNFIHDKLLFAYYSGFDIDYRKFGMGHIYIFKQLQWCFEQDFCIYEMGWGAYDYKQKWCNLIYDSGHYLLYNKTLITPRIKANFELAKIKLKKYLKSIKVDVFLKKLKNHKNNRLEDAYTITIFQKPLNSITDKDSPINLQNKEYFFLIKYVYDFLYSSQENELNAQVFEIKKDQLYLIKGKTINAHIEKKQHVT